MSSASENSLSMDLVELFVAAVEQVAHETFTVFLSL